MTTYPQRVLEAEFPGEDARYFVPMSVGLTPQSADEGAVRILEGIKTATSSAHWDYPDGRIPFVGALSVLLNGKEQPVAIIQTERVEIRPFGMVDEAFARTYGEGDRTLKWFWSEIGAWYRESAARRCESVSDDTPIICEWFTVVRRLSASRGSAHFS